MKTDVATQAAVLPQPPAASGEQLPLFDASALGAVREEEARWKKEVYEPLTSKRPFWKKDFTTVSAPKFGFGREAFTLCVTPAAVRVTPAAYGSVTVWPSGN